MGHILDLALDESLQCALSLLMYTCVEAMYSTCSLLFVEEQ